MFEWKSNNRAIVIIQPSERTSGVDVSMDGRRNGSRPSAQTTVNNVNNLNNMLR